VSSCARFYEELPAAGAKGTDSLLPVHPPQANAPRRIELAHAAAHVRNTMDVALLIQPQSPQDAPMQQSLRWVKGEKQAGRLVLALNLFIYEPGAPKGTAKPRVNDPSFRPKGMKQHAMLFAHELCSAARASHTPISFLMVPHDFRPHRFRGEYHDDGAYLNDIAQQMVSSCAAHVHLLNGGHVYEPTESVFVLKHVDGTVSGLMHLLILSASVGTPGLALINQFKFVSFQRMIYPSGTYAGSDNCVHDFTVPKALAAGVRLFASNIQRNRQELASRLPFMKRLSERNFDMLRVGTCTKEVHCALED
jgi:hypothetical protein